LGSVVLRCVGLPEAILQSIEAFHDAGLPPKRRRTTIDPVLRMPDRYANGLLIAGADDAPIDPLTRAECRLATGRQKSVGPPGDPPMPLVLLVDDHRDTARLLARLLRAEGFEVEALDSGAAALAFLLERPAKPSLILMDIMMPGMDGFETLCRLRLLEASKHVPVVMLSAVTDEEHQERARKLGAAEYWIKGTFDHESLVRMIRRHV
jgi:CheY-like chemotaxis protein